LSDSLVNEDRIKTVNELEKKYNQAKNEQTIKSLSQQRKIYLLLIVLALLGLLVLFFAYRQQKLKNKQKIIEVEQRLNRARMNPHFFFNTLTALQTMALQKSPDKTLGLNLSKFAAIMRITLESTYHEYVTIYDETAYLTTYLNLQQLRFPNKFDFEIKQEDDLDTEAHLIPSMLIQPFVENAIEHGFNNIDYTGKLDINFSLQHNEIIITVTDNGRGLGPTTNKHENHISRAVQIVEDRLFLLNRQQKTKARFRIEPALENTGVQIRLYLPVLPHRIKTTAVG
jgi:LytS/YehU family sensor histidine kinase